MPQKHFNSLSYLCNSFLSRYFRQSKLTSFQRQLNLYGFQRLTRGADAGGYYHELFLRNRVFLAKLMDRTKVKGTRFKAASSPESEPDFSTMEPVVPQVSSDEEYSHGSATADTFVPSELVSFEPLPIQYSYQPQAALVQPTLPYYASAIPQSVQPPIPLQNNNQAPVDPVLDQAVDELFLSGNDTLADFCFDWDPTGTGVPLEDDIQLGFMLEKLLED